MELIAPPNNGGYMRQQIKTQMILEGPFLVTKIKGDILQYSTSINKERAGCSHIKITKISSLIQLRLIPKQLVMNDQALNMWLNES